MKWTDRTMENEQQGRESLAHPIAHFNDPRQSQNMKKTYAT